MKKPAAKVKKPAKSAARKPAGSRRSTAPRKPVALAPASTGLIQGWTTDPLGGLPPLPRPAPALPGTPLPTRIVAPTPAPRAGVHATGTPEFRFWAAADALRRCAEFWSGIGVGAWNPAIGTALAVRLDEGLDLNAYYARNAVPLKGIQQGLSFFHDTVLDAGTGQLATVFSGESPDVVCHELGHAILDSLKPELWNLASIEAGAFHEAFGDVSAMLTALQLPAVQQAILQETGGKLSRSSSVSRVAEQLGYAIRQRHPDAVDSDSLRNASNSFVYTDPAQLPPKGPASSLSRASHNFSRVFTGAFLEVLSGMVLRLSGTPGADDVLQAARDLAQILVTAVVAAPPRLTFFQAVAEQMIVADRALFRGKYAEPLRTALVRRRLLSPEFLANPLTARELGRLGIAGAADLAAGSPQRVVVDGSSLGLSATPLYVDVPAEGGGLDPAAGAAPALNLAAGTSLRPAAVESFLEGLIVRGRVEVGTVVTASPTLAEAPERRGRTHHLVAMDHGFELQRMVFECGCGRGE